MMTSETAQQRAPGATFADERAAAAVAPEDAPNGSGTNGVSALDVEKAVPSNGDAAVRLTEP
jgi:hypothetical protein